MYSLTFGKQLWLLLKMKLQQVWRLNGIKLIIFNAVLFCFYFFWQVPTTMSRGGTPVFFGHTDPTYIAINMICNILPMIVLLNIFIKGEPGVMDDFARSRPISNKAFNAYIFLRDAFNPINSIMPIMWMALAISCYPLDLAILATVAGFILTAAASLSFSVLKRCQSFDHKIAFWVVATISFVIIILYGINFFNINPIVLLSTSIALCLLVILAFYIFSCYLPCYGDKTVKNKRTKSLSANFFTMNFTYALRSPGGKIFYFMPLMIIAFVCLLGAILPSSDPTSNLLFCCMTYFASILIPFSIGNQTFGSEANFFDGLWTRPCTIRKILTTKYYFYALTAIVPLFLCFIGIAAVGAFDKIPPLLFLVFLVYIFGFQLFFYLIPIFFARRVPLDQAEAMKNGNNALWTLPMVLLSMIPLGAFVAAIKYLPEPYSYIVLGAVGLVGTIFHRQIIGWFASRYTANRHKHFSKYRQ